MRFLLARMRRGYLIYNIQMLRGTIEAIVMPLTNGTHAVSEASVRGVKIVGVGWSG